MAYILINFAVMVVKDLDRFRAPIVSWSEILSEPDSFYAFRHCNGIKKRQPPCILLGHILRYIHSSLYRRDIEDLPRPPCFHPCVSAFVRQSYLRYIARTAPMARYRPRWASPK